MNGPGAETATPGGKERLAWLWWLPALAWMGLIFLGSTDLLSSDHTSRFLAPFLRWLIPGISEATIEALRAFIRKSGHVVEYALLAGWVMVALQRSFNPRRWHWRARTAALALGVCVLYAASDEWHQSFIPSRQGCARDVLIDTAGALGGLALLRLLKRRSPPAGSTRSPGKMQNVP